MNLLDLAPAHRAAELRSTLLYFGQHELFVLHQIEVVVLDLVPVRPQGAVQLCEGGFDLGGQDCHDRSPIQRYQARPGNAAATHTADSEAVTEGRNEVEEPVNRHHGWRA